MSVQEMWFHIESRRAGTESRRAGRWSVLPCSFERSLAEATVARLDREWGGAREHRLTAVPDDGGQETAQPEPTVAGEER